MPYYAQIDDNGNVIRVIVADTIEWCQQRLGGTWVQTSYTGSQRKNYAGIGYKYRADIDAFTPPQPAYNYDLDTETARWTFPADNHLYIPASVEIAERLSRALYTLIVPGGEGLYAGVIPHPSGKGHSLLQCRSTDIRPVALGADPQPLIDVLQIPVDDGTLTREELRAIVGAVQAMAGRTVDLIDFIPLSWQPFVMTRAEAEAAGYFDWEQRHENPPTHHPISRDDSRARGQSRNN